MLRKLYRRLFVRSVGIDLGWTELGVSFDLLTGKFTWWDVVPRHVNCRCAPLWREERANAN